MAGCRVMVEDVTEVLIRPATVSDARQIARVHIASWREVHVGDHVRVGLAPGGDVHAGYLPRVAHGRGTDQDFGDVFDHDTTPCHPGVSWATPPGPDARDARRSSTRGRPVNVSGGALDLAGLEAGGADVDPLRRAGDDRTHALDVGVPAPLGPAVGVGDAVPEARALAADVAVGSHVYLLIVHATLVRRRWSGVRGSPGGDTAPGSRGCADRAGQPR